MDTIPQLKEEAQQLRKRLEILEQAVENVGNCKRIPEPGEIWERGDGSEWLCLSNDEQGESPYWMMHIEKWFDTGFTALTIYNQFTFKRKAQL